MQREAPLQMLRCDACYGKCVCVKAYIAKRKYMLACYCTQRSTTDSCGSIDTPCFIIKVTPIITRHSHVLQSVLQNRVNCIAHDQVLVCARGSAANKTTIIEQLGAKCKRAVNCGHIYAFNYSGQRAKMERRLARDRV